jgi:hypothetical protein
MYRQLRRIQLLPRRPIHRIVVLGMFVFLLVGVVMAQAVLHRPSSAHADTGAHRLEALWNNGGTLQHRWSDDGGTTWSAWATVPPLPNGMSEATAVSASVGLLTIVTTTNDGTGNWILKFITYNYFTNQWSGWGDIPGGAYHTYYNPVLTNWGSGHMDLVVYGLSDDGSEEVLLHTSADNSIWSGTWETLDDAPHFSSAPSTASAVSWGPGRIDVFERGSNFRLKHRWYDNGQWSSGWEDLGAPSATVVLNSAPSAASPGAGRLDIFASGSDLHLWHLSFAGAWGSWEDLGCCGTNNSLYSVAATSQAPMTLDIFVVDNNQNLSRKHYDYNAGGLTSSQFLDNVNNFSSIGAFDWVTFIPPTATPRPPTSTPRPTATPPPRRCLQPPCHVTP